MLALSAGIAGTICNIITNPLWIVRTRMQTEIFNSVSRENFMKKWGRPLSLLINLREMVRNEGILSLSNGISASFIGLLHPVVFFPIYEKLKERFRENNPEMCLSEYCKQESADYGFCRGRNGCGNLQFQ